MANTYTLIEGKTLAATAASVTFTAIPQTYTDLLLKVSARDDFSGFAWTDLGVQFGYNGTINTGAIYTFKQLYGNGSATGSQGTTSGNYLFVGVANAPTSTSSTFGNTEIYIPNYTSANYKSISVDGVSENNATAALAAMNAGIANTTDAITDIKISAVYGSGLYQIHSTFYLYGIKNS